MIRPAGILGARSTVLALVLGAGCVGAGRAATAGEPLTERSDPTAVPRTEVEIEAVPEESVPARRVLEGPEGVTRRIEEDAEVLPLFRLPTLQDWGKPYFDWKKGLKEDHGLAFGLTVHTLYSHADRTLEGQNGGFGGIFRLHGSWSAVGRGTGHPGRLEWRVENRSAFGGNPSPGETGADVGAAALNTAFGYGDGFDTDLSVLSWVQGFRDSTAGVAIGRLAFDAYQDAFLFQTFSRGFLNRAFLLNPTAGTTGIGALGIAAKGFVTDQVWIGGQGYDANAESGDFDLDTIEEGEFLTSVEVGWTPSTDRYKTDRVQLTYWHKDRRDEAGVPSGQGWLVSSSFALTDQLIPFARFGHSDGGAGVAAETAASVGLEWTPRTGQALSVGFGWADPSEETFGRGLRDEYVLETSYRLQLTENFSLLPDVQLLLDPANDPSEDAVWVVGIRALLSI